MRRPHSPVRLLGLGAWFALLAGAATSATAQPQPLGPMRPPAVPLVAHDPYFSVWSAADRLTDVDTTHWTGKPQPIRGRLVVDGQSLRVLGGPKDAPALPQTGLTVLPTRTIATFAGAGVELMLTFLTPALPDDLDLLARPTTYVVWDVRSTDGRAHQVTAELEASPLLAVDTADQVVHREAVGGADAGYLGQRVGTVDQPVLERAGDDLRIDWGHLVLVAPAGANATARGPAEVVDVAAEAMAPLALTLGFGEVGATAVSRWAVLAYDDGASILYFDEPLRPYWKRDGLEFPALLSKAMAEYPALRRRCEEFDSALMADLERTGGAGYARLAALSYREAMAANKIACDRNGKPLCFSKENFSNGCIATVDVFYPMAPIALSLSPALMKATLVPLLDYAASPRWKFPFAPHDLGTYPHANGQVYGGGERTEENQMPVEESANMILLMAAVAKADGNLDFVAPHWPLLVKWAGYLKDKGFDPENQLCTDDFAGHLAHNVNLSAKAIVALGAFAQLAQAKGDIAVARTFGELARTYAARWIQEAADGDHTRLAFDRPGTWSQKYNLVWDRVLGLNLFPAEVFASELAYYRTHQNTFGLPLDNRADYTKLDWIVWTACLTGERADFEALLAPAVRFVNETPSRVPMTDWYDTKTGKQVGFQARPVVGGVYLPLLTDAALWSKWAARGAQVTGPWAALPTPSERTVVVPTAREAKSTWRYTTEAPAADWMAVAFDASGWREGTGGFGSPGTPGAAIGTPWTGREIWLRRSIDLPEGSTDDLRLLIHHDEDVEVYLNGVLAVRRPGYTTEYRAVRIRPEALANLKPGVNTLAIRCRQTTGGQYIDAGLVRVQATPAAR